jgi:hypothetical protein
MKTSASIIRAFWLTILLSVAFSVTGAETITLKSLLAEMTGPADLARFPEPEYQCLQATSYNRASTNRNQPDQTVTGWFADSDGTGFIRTETNNGNQEWVIMEHTGPGCITKMWTPFFYYDFNERVGPNVRIYLDGSDTPVIDESLIKLVLGEGSFRPPLAAPTARAGDSYVPIPFAKSCKITMAKRSFYNSVNYRAYPVGTKVETFTRAGFEAATENLERAGMALTARPDASMGALKKSAALKPGGKMEVQLPSGPNALGQFTLRLPGAVNNPACLRSTVLAMTFDGEETVWCPIGDFFCSADSLHPIQTWQRSVTADGTMVCRWVMPYRSSAAMRVLNLGRQPVDLELRAGVSHWDWDKRSMHFHANWRPDDVVPGAPFQDWNFIDIRGRGVYVGDAWTVLNITGSWWGEGDEKIYVDGAWDKGFPTHFGTGSEDYYGWAGGVVPTRQDEFSAPFLANARVGGLDGQTKGFNICTRTRSLDAIPFTERLRFDMESSFGTDIRHTWNLLGYSVVTMWYAKPGATHNRPALPEAAAHPIMTLAELQAKSDAIKARVKTGRVSPQSRSASQNPVRVFIVAGQSNAEGHNNIRQYHGGKEEFPEILRMQPRILFWPGINSPPASENLWTTLHVQGDGSFGPEISLAHDLEQKMPGETIAIVKYASGGTGIARSVDYADYIPAVAGFNDKGRNWHPPTDGREAGNLYRALTANIRSALSALERDGRTWELSGFVWMQGEHEAGISRKMAGDYERLLSDFVRSVRKDLRAPNLPFAIGQINSHTWAYGDIARACQVEVCRKDTRTILVQTVDLPRVSGDAAHFTADGMLTLGSRFADAMMTLVSESGSVRDPLPAAGQ